MSDSIIIFGADGYIGWPLAVHLGSKYPEKKIVLVDNLATRKLVKSVHTRSLVPIKSMPHRIAAYERVTGHHNLEFVFADVRDSELVETVFRKHRPESVVHLAQQRSAPFSMIRSGARDVLRTEQRRDKHEHRFFHGKKRARRSSSEDGQHGEYTDSPE